MERKPWFVLCLLLIFLVVSAPAKKVILPDLVLKARYVAVVIYPNQASNRYPSSITPTTYENQVAQSDVEQALRKWKRYEVTAFPSEADLIFAVRKGARAQMMIGIPVTGKRPTIGGEVGPGEDMLAVYQGGRSNPLDSAPLWRYMAKNALASPSVPAVLAFRKAVEAAEKKGP